jgi:hypothetical protein
VRAARAVDQIIVKPGSMRAYVIWIPMLDADEGSEVPYASRNVGLSPQYFDGSMLVGNALSKTLGRTGPVWDTFMFFPPGAAWTDGGLPMPERLFAQDNGVVVAMLDTLPPDPDQSKLPRDLRGKGAVVGAQKDFEELLRRVADPFAAKYRKTP